MKQLINITENAYLLEEFLGEDECQGIIAVADAMGFAKGLPDNRLPVSHKKLADEIWLRLSDFIPEQLDDLKVVGVSPDLCIQKLEPGQAVDVPATPIENEGDNDEPHSQLIARLYLNSNFNAGEFAIEETPVKPHTGLALIHRQTVPMVESAAEDEPKYILIAKILYQAVPEVTS